MPKYILVRFEKDEEADEFKQAVADGDWGTVTPDEVIYYTESLTEMWQELMKRHG